MAFYQKTSLLISKLFFLILSLIVVMVSSTPNVERLTDAFTKKPIFEAYKVLFGSHNIHLMNNGSYLHFALDNSSGSGLTSKDKYFHGFFNAALKLPSGHSPGVVVAFYMSNEDIYPDNHDEIDIELLGHQSSKKWVLQTNIYGNGSVNMGREEKLHLWFDPTKSFHDYTILWNHHHIVFLVDNVPVREMIHNAATSSVYPSKPMSAYVTIWDGSAWATHGGKYPVNYKYAPFVASLRGVELEGCTIQVINGRNTSPFSCVRRSTSRFDPMEGEGFVKLSQQQRIGLNWARGKHMFYSYCKDKARYKVLPPDCIVNFLDS